MSLKDSSASRSADRANTDPAEWVDRYGDVLYRYAIVRVRKQEVAEDLVQDTLLAALKSQDTFEGHSAEQTWLVGILRHKIMDHIRSRSRGMAKITDDSPVDWLAEFFDDRGSWRKPPDPTTIDPGSLLEKEEFWEAFDSCLDTLPPRTREAFARRVIEHEETSIISKALDVTANNLWVILFRARTQMRRCLMHKWFGEPPESEQSAEKRATASRGGTPYDDQLQESCGTHLPVARSPAVALGVVQAVVSPDHVQAVRHVPQAV